MEAVIFVGLQGAGKTTFYVDRFLHTHVRISLDTLRTRHRERSLVHWCIETQQRFVVDNTNPTASERARYIEPAREGRFQIIGYVFEPDVAGSIERNAARTGRLRVPKVAIYDTRKRLEVPSMEEGFDRLYHVTIASDGNFLVTPSQTTGRRPMSDE